MTRFSFFFSFFGSFEGVGFHLSFVQFSLFFKVLAGFGEDVQVRQQTEVKMQLIHDNQ